MYSNLQCVDSKAHATLKFKEIEDFSFMEQKGTSPLTVSEMAMASKFYPIVFSANTKKDGSGKQAVPMAVFSFVPKTNPFITNKGKWTVPFIPAHVRRYPFALAPVQNSNNFALMIDVDAPNLIKRGGELLFDQDGNPANILKNAKSFLMRYQRDVALTAALMAQLEEADVLVPYQFSLGDKDNARKIRGFRVVDQKKIAALDDSTLAQWVRNGLMSLVFAHISSMDNVRTIVESQAESLKQ
jgi:hypothetical protein